MATAGFPSKPQQTPKLQHVDLPRFTSIVDGAELLCEFFAAFDVVY
jgi:hypothetical protein